MNKFIVCLVLFVIVSLSILNHVCMINTYYIEDTVQAENALSKACIIDNNTYNNVLCD